MRTDVRPSDNGSCLSHHDSYDSLMLDKLPIIEAVGYTTGNHTLENYCVMKVSALAQCLHSKWFLQGHSGLGCVSDTDLGSFPEFHLPVTFTISCSSMGHHSQVILA